MNTRLHVLAPVLLLAPGCLELMSPPGLQARLEAFEDETLEALAQIHRRIEEETHGVL